MKTIKNFALIITALIMMVVISSYMKTNAADIVKTEPVDNYVPSQQMVNLFVTHGHCSTPFAGQVSNLNFIAAHKDNLSNPLENMKIDFEIDPNTFNVCKSEDLTNKIKTPGLFIGDNNEKIKFKSTQVYTMGLDWYQVNGKLSIKGVEKDVKIFATGIRKAHEIETTELVLQSQFNLLDWGIDYDKIVSGKSDQIPTKWMYLNMKIDVVEVQENKFQEIGK